ncbi:hypothetical protein SDC9_106406 [bioreactor metagenome]|uniref:Uncharacterized protein n=1 Tax=bioreactor metagenome TaxID=1076179 RepID=A0A645B283_9ZZZZ
MYGRCRLSKAFQNRGYDLRQRGDQLRERLDQANRELNGQFDPHSHERGQVLCDEVDDPRDELRQRFDQLRQRADDTFR